MTLTQKLVRELLDYNPASGLLTWKTRNRKWFATENAWATWNTRFAGKTAFTHVGTHGYLEGRIFGILYLAHRIVWLGQTGRLPKITDHKNHNRTDNRWSNLSETLNNNHNLSLATNNTSGHTGVGKRGSVYRAYIQVDGKYLHLGTFESLSDALTARKIAERKYGFSPRHGERI